MDEWDTKTQAFIQWKGTDACIDLHCPKCGYHNHYDGFFAYNVECAKCHTRFAMPELLTFTEADPGAEPVLKCEYAPDDEDADSAGEGS